MNGLIRRWYDRNLSFYLYPLMPFSFIYRSVIWLRRQYYAFKPRKIFSAPIIVVGNITVGGTGKTPLVIWLANFLREQGYTPGIVSRGYGGKAIHYPLSVTADTDPKQAGDEAVLIAKRTNCPMVVSPNRVVAVETLLTTGCNVVISDDGMQHYAMPRDVEIGMVDAKRGFGNGYCLPAGPLREPITRAQRCDYILINGELLSQPWISAFAGMTVFPSHSRESGNPTASNNLHSFQLLPGSIYNLKQPNRFFTAEQVGDKRVHAVAGIGHPARFFDLLGKLGWQVIEHSFPDHYFYRPEDFVFAKKEDVIIMTEKDAVKCQDFARDNMWCLPVTASPSSEFSTSLIKQLQGLSSINKGASNHAKNTRS